MDENKDLTTPENTVESKVLPKDTQEADEAVEAAEQLDELTDTAESTDDALADFSDNTEIDALADNEAPAKKKPVLQTTIIISLVIVLIAALTVLAIMFFFNNSVSGSWHLVREVQVRDDGATSDEAVHPLDVDYYFDFKDDGTVTATIGTVSSSGTYSTAVDDEGNTIVTMDTYDPLTQYFLNGDYTLSLSGNIFTGRKMNFTSVNNAELSYDFESASYKAPEITREGDFEVNDDVVGSWTYSSGEFKLTYEFDKDGNARYVEEMMSINPYTYTPMNINITMNGIYSVDGEKLTITYFFLEQDDNTITVRRDGDVLYINDYPFTKDGAATVDQVTTVAAQ